MHDTFNERIKFQPKNVCKLYVNGCRSVARIYTFAAVLFAFTDDARTQLYLVLFLVQKLQLLKG